MPTDIVSLERTCAAGWPGIRSRSWGDWHGRYGNGFTSRANSALILGAPDSGLSDAVEQVTRWYADLGRPPIFQLPSGAALAEPVPTIDAWLQQAGWRIGDRVSVQTALIDDVLRQGADGADLMASLDTSPGADWLSSYLYRGKSLGAEAVPVLTAGPGPVFLSLSRGAAVVGVGRGVVTDGWLGVTAVTVAPSARRSGVGTAVLTELLRWGRDQHAHSVYLQVDRANTVALAMYARLGFTEHHGYHYLLAPDRPAN